MSYSQEGNKNMKTNILIRICTKKKFVRKKANLFNLYASLNEWELQKVKSVQIESVFFYDISKTLSQKNFINFIQKNFMEKQAGNFTNTHQLWELSLLL